MQYNGRYIKICMLGSIALFFSLIAFGNLTDFNTNWVFVQHVLSMDTTFRTPALMSRAITSPTIQLVFYYLIIAWESITALLCWIGCINLIRKIKSPCEEFNRTKQTAYLGLFCGFLLYMVGFFIIGGEWFSMWQSASWNVQAKAGLFVTIITLVMIFMSAYDS